MSSLKIKPFQPQHFAVEVEALIYKGTLEEEHWIVFEV